MINQKLKIINNDLIINNVPLEKIYVNQPTVTIELDDKDEKRHRLTFFPIQAQRIITIDCANSDSFFCEDCLKSGVYQRYILEVENSEWIKQLKSELMKNDESATFMNKARHFVIDLRDNIIEVIAWDYKIESL